MSVLPLKTWHICTVLKEKGKENNTERNMCRCLMVKSLKKKSLKRQEIVHYPAGFLSYPCEGSEIGFL